MTKDTYISKDLLEDVSVKTSSADLRRATVDISQVDVAAKLVNGGYEEACSVEDARRVRYGFISTCEERMFSQVFQEEN